MDTQISLQKYNNSVHICSDPSGRPGRRLCSEEWKRPDTHTLMGRHQERERERRSKLSAQMAHTEKGLRKCSRRCMATLVYIYIYLEIDRYVISTYAIDVAFRPQRRKGLRRSTYEKRSSSARRETTQRFKSLHRLSGEKRRFSICEIP